jgi:hypothetical protein
MCKLLGYSDSLSNVTKSRARSTCIYKERGFPPLLLNKAFSTHFVRTSHTSVQHSSLFSYPIPRVVDVCRQGVGCAQGGHFSLLGYPAKQGNCSVAEGLSRVAVV